MGSTPQATHLALQSRLEALIASLYPNHPVSPSEADGLFFRSVQLLPLLNNPLNIELLARHILQSPAIWVSDSVRRHSRIVGGFRSSLEWKVTDLKEGKGGIALDEWIASVGRGAIGNGITLALMPVDLAPAWKHLLIFSGLRSGISEETNVLKRTKQALEHAYIRAFFVAIDDVTRDIAEAILYSLALMEHMNPTMLDQLFTFGNPEHLLIFLVDAVFSSLIGFFNDVPIALSSLGRPSDTVRIVRDLDSHIIQPYIPRISGIISRTFPLVRDPRCLFSAVDGYLLSKSILSRPLALSDSVHNALISLPNGIAQSFVNTDSSLTANTDIVPILWETLKRLLFATVMSLQGVVTNIMHSSHLRNESTNLSLVMLEIMNNLAFVSARFGNSGFDEWNFVYLASIDLLSSNPSQASSFIEKHIPDPLAQHPSAKADALYFLDTLEHFIPVLPPPTIHSILPIIRQYLQPQSTLRPHLESAHSVFLAILARGDILHDQIFPYIDQVYNAFPQALKPQQIRLAFSTIVKLSLPNQVPLILTNLLQHAQTARTDPLPGTTGPPTDEQLTYFFAFVDCLPWLGVEEIEFWLNQLVFAMRGVKGLRRDALVRRIWEGVSGEMGGDGGLKAVEWWVNGGKAQIMSPKL